MKNKSKILITLAVLTVGIFGIGFSSIAQAAITATLGTGTGAVGSNVSIPLTVNENPDLDIAAGGLATLSFDIRYKPNVFPTPSFTKTSVLTDLGLSLSYNRFVDPTDSAFWILRGVIIDMNASPDSPQIGVPNGILANVNFLSSGAGATATTYPLTLTARSVDKDSAVMATTSNSGSITLTGGHTTYNYTNFTQLVADWLQTKTSVADLSGNGTVNAQDLGIMMSYWAE